MESLFSVTTVHLAPEGTNTAYIPKSKLLEYIGKELELPITTISISIYQREGK